MADAAFLRELGQQLRVDSVRAAAVTSSGHPTSSMSAADLMAVLLANHLRYDFDAPDNPANDHLIFSKGHASPLLYSIYKAAGAITDEELLTFRKFGSRLEGHPTPVIPWVDVATGSLGQGLPLGVGVALAGKKLDRLPYRVWVLHGDSEIAEGSVWEAFEHAAYAKLDNLTAIIDVNRLGQRGETMHGWDLDSYANRARAFGWHAIEIDGHDVEAIDRAYAEAESIRDRHRRSIVARTLKGKGVKAVEDKPGWHGKALDDPDEAIAELGGMRNLRVDVAKPEPGEPHVFETGPLELPRYELGDGGRDPEGVRRRARSRSARRAATSSRSTARSRTRPTPSSSPRSIPERYFEMFIAEQQMVAAAVGMQVRGWRPFASTFAAFLSRAYDFVRMAAICRARPTPCAARTRGVSIGEDGPSQMALEDIAEFRAVHGSTVLYPSDANQTAQLVAPMADLEGISFLRTTRREHAGDLRAGRGVPGRRLHVVRSSDDDEVTIVGAGITLHEALKAADALAEEGVSRACHRPLLGQADRRGEPARRRRGDRRPGRHRRGPLAGGRPRRGGALRARGRVRGHARTSRSWPCSELPTSGKPAELLAAAGIDAEAIAEAARALVRTAVQA